MTNKPKQAVPHLRTNQFSFVASILNLSAYSRDYMKYDKGLYFRAELKAFCAKLEVYVITMRLFTL